jgi:hypothetical protein
VNSATSRATIQNAAFSRMSDPGFIGETEGSSQSVFTRVRNQFTFSYRSELSARVVKSASVVKT